MKNKIQTSNAIFLAIVMVAGTISTIIPTATFAQPQYDYFNKQQYKGYEDSYAKDYDKKKSSDFNLQKVKCNNVIINGVDNAGQEPGDMQGEITEEDDGIGQQNQWLGNGEKKWNDINENIVNICINKNEQIRVVQEPPNPPPLDPNGDEDGDLLLNSWETDGIDSDSDGNIDFVLVNANPLHKDLYVEVDFMQLHEPIAQGISNVIDSFANSPVSNPDGINGITLHVDVDEEIPHQDTTSTTDLVNIRNTNQGTVAERADANSANILSAKRMTHHYGLFGHSQPGTSSSGISNGIPAMEFLVSLGNGWPVDPVTGHSVGTLDQQEGTFMHELGHNLNLHHGGSDDINCKPNYLSVMTYARQFSSLIGDRPLDYSRNEIGSLDETNLSEPDGIGQSDPTGLTTVYGPATPDFVAAGNPVDWNRDTDVLDNGVNADINFVDSCGVSPNQVLSGFDDWENIVYITTPAAGVSPMLTNELNVLQEVEIPEELTLDDVKQHRIQLLEGIEQAIITALGEIPETLQEEIPENQTEIPETIQANIQQIRASLQSEDLAQAITELEELKNNFIAILDQPNLIVVPNAEQLREKVIFQIENMKLVLEKQIPETSEVPK